MDHPERIARLRLADSFSAAGVRRADPDGPEGDDDIARVAALLPGWPARRRSLA